MSSGVGPFTVSGTSRSRKKTSRSGKRSKGRGQSGSGADLAMMTLLGVAPLLSAGMDRMEQRRDEKLQQALEAERVLTSLHLENFPAVERVVIKDPRRWWRRLLPMNDVMRAQIEQEQQDADRTWLLLNQHDPATVIAAVDDAFADNASSSACIDAGVDGAGAYVTTVVTFTGPEIIVARDAAGRRTEREKAAIYRTAVASTVVATAKEALAFAPMAVEALVIVLRRDKRRDRRFGRVKNQLVVIYAGAFDRSVSSIDWRNTEVAEVVFGRPEALFERDLALNLPAVALDGFPDLQEILRQVERVAVENEPYTPT